MPIIFLEVDLSIIFQMSNFLEVLTEDVVDSDLDKEFSYS